MKEGTDLTALAQEIVDQLAKHLDPDGPEVDADPKPGAASAAVKGGMVQDVAYMTGAHTTYQASAALQELVEHTRQEGNEAVAARLAQVNVYLWQWVQFTFIDPEENTWGGERDEEWDDFCSQLAEAQEDDPELNT